jgi:hypothetical protein
MTNSLKKTNGSVTGRLVGGVGNQLFIYSAARQLAEVNKSTLILDVSQIGVGGTNHGTLLSETNLSGEFKFIKNRLPKILLRVENKTKRLMKKRFKFDFFLRGTYVSEVLGFDGKVLTLNPPITLSGYFQSWRYSEEILPIIKEEIGLKHYSNWFLQMRAIMKEERPIVIHVRRGDYVNLADDFGILGLEYYENALARIEEEDLDKKFSIWVFSDDVQKARNLLSNVSQRKIVFVDPPDNISVLESLLLMTGGSAHVIANSTFSWWAARLSETTQIVVAPKTWFRNREDPIDLLPPDWKLADSHWDVG